MKDRKDSFLQRGTQVNEQVSAANQVQPGEWRVFGQILASENDHFPNRLCDSVTASISGKKPPKPFGRNVQSNVFDVGCLPSPIQCTLAQIGRKDLNRQI